MRGKTRTYAKIFALVSSSIILVLAAQNIGSCLLRLKTGEGNQHGPEVVPSSKMLSLLAMGEERSLGDLLMVKLTLQIGEVGVKRLPVEYAIGMMKAVTELDPQDLEPYSFAFYLLSFNKKAIPAIIRFLKMGMKRQPHQWRLPLWISLLYKWELRETEMAKRWATVAAQYPNAPPHVKRLPSYFLYKEGKYQTALEMLSTLYNNSKSEREKRILAKKIELMKQLIVLNSLVRHYHAIYHRFPDSLEELVQAGFIPQIPSPPYPHRRYILDHRHRRVVMEGW